MLKSIPIQQFNPPETPLFLQYFWVDFSLTTNQEIICVPSPAVMGHNIFTFVPSRGKIPNTFKTSKVQVSLIKMASSRPAPCLKQSQQDCWLPNKPLLLLSCDYTRCILSLLPDGHSQEPGS